MKIINFIILFFLFKTQTSSLLTNLNKIQKIIRYKFISWNNLHNKQYLSGLDFKYRLKIYNKNLETIKIHNKSNSSYKLGETVFADLTDKEFMSMFTSKIFKNPNPKENFPDSKIMEIIKNTNMKILKRKKSPMNFPRSVDWVSLNKVVPPQNQGSCGSCYAFTSIAATESLYAIQNNIEAIPFSKQYMVDCGFKYGLAGCEGGSSYDSFKFIKNIGVIKEEDDPYIENQKKCYLKNPFFKIKGWQYIRGEVSHLLENIAHGPVFITLEVTPSLKLYYQDVYETKAPCGFFINHAVLAVGYDLDAPKPYILIKNSWGTNWGIGGYLKWYIGTKLNSSGMCFIANSNNLRPY